MCSNAGGDGGDCGDGGEGGLADGAGVFDHGAAAGELGGDEALVGFEDREGVRGFLQVGKFDKHCGAKFRKNLNLAGAGAFLGAEDFAFDFFEFRCEEALAADGRLFANVVVGNRTQIGFRDFDEVAEDGGESDLERFDARAFDFFSWRAAIQFFPSWDAERSSSRVGSKPA